MSENKWQVRDVALPGESSICGLYEVTELADAYAIRLPHDAVSDPELLARFMFGQPSPWVKGLMRLRDTLVAGFGLKTARQMQTASPSELGQRIAIFRIYSKTANEIVLGENDKHLDFRISVLRRMEATASGQAPYLIVSTVVHCHNLLGRSYLKVITPFHRMLSRSTLRRAARAGWPSTAQVIY